MDKLNVGIVGCGFVSQERHIPSFKRLGKQVSVCAACDLNQKLAAEVARRFGISHVYSDLSEMLSKENLDIIDICTPPRAHAAVAVEALNSGCNVLMEKPMALSVHDCDEMISAAEKHNVKLSVVHNQRFYPVFIRAQELVKKGIIGKITGMRILSATNRKDYMINEKHWCHKLPCGILGETGPHTVYLSLAFLKNVEDVDICMRKTLEYPWVQYDEYTIDIMGEDISSSIVISHANEFTASQVDLFGIKGMIRADLQSQLLTLYRRENLRPLSLALSSLVSADQAIRSVTSNILRVISLRTFLGHDIMIAEFVKSIKDDQPVPVSPEEGRETVRVMEMITDKLNRSSIGQGEVPSRGKAKDLVQKLDLSE